MPIEFLDVKNSFHKLDLPIAEKISNEIISLPIGPHLTNTDFEKVVDSLIEIQNK